MKAWIHTLTVDVSVDLDRALVGVGIVIRQRTDSNRRGPILDRLSECHDLVHQRGTEEFAALRALQVAKERGYSRLKIRMDANSVRRILREAHRARRLLPGIRGEILELAASFDFVDFSWVPRRKNQMAHSLAREALGIDWRSKRARLTEFSTAPADFAELLRYEGGDDPDEYDYGHDPDEHDCVHDPDEDDCPF